MRIAATAVTDGSLSLSRSDYPSSLLFPNGVAVDNNGGHQTCLVMRIRANIPSGCPVGYTPMAKRESEEEINARLRELAEQIRGLRREMATDLQRPTGKLMVARATERPPRKSRKRR